MAPESVLRTVSTSRNSDSQNALGRPSSSGSGSASTLSKSLRPMPTSMRSAAFCMSRLRAWRRMWSNTMTMTMPMARPWSVVSPA